MEGCMVIDFPNHQDTTVFCGQVIKIPRTKADFLSVAKRFLTEDDYHDICVGILDADYYLEIEPPLQKVVDTYYSYFP
jgi:hypothetical protein